MVACGVTERRVIPFQNLLCVFLQRQRVFFLNNLIIDICHFFQTNLTHKLLLQIIQKREDVGLQYKVSSHKLSNKFLKIITLLVKFTWFSS